MTPKEIKKFEKHKIDSQRYSKYLEYTDEINKNNDELTNLFCHLEANMETPYEWLYLVKNDFLANASKYLILAAVSEEDELVTYLASAARIIYNLSKQNYYKNIENSLLQMRGNFNTHTFTGEITDYGRTLQSALGEYLKTVETIDKLTDRNLELQKSISCL